MEIEKKEKKGLSKVATKGEILTAFLVIIFASSLITTGLSSLKNNGDLPRFPLANVNAADQNITETTTTGTTEVFLVNQSTTYTTTSHTTTTEPNSTTTIGEVVIVQQNVIPAIEATTQTETLTINGSITTVSTILGTSTTSITENTTCTLTVGFQC